MIQPVTRKDGGLRTQGYYKFSNDKYPLISIITVVLNAANYLEDTIQSVINQTYRNIEYIIIDGGSKDTTLNVIKNYETLIDYWASEPDEGISDAFNKGINLARGDIIGIINAGDWYDREACQLISKYAKKYDDFSIFYGDIIKVNQKGDFLYKRKATNKIQFYLKNPRINHPTVFVKRCIYNEIGKFSNEYKVAMDYEWLRRAFCNQCKFIYLQEKPLVSMRVEGISTLNYGFTLYEVHKISVTYGDNILVSFIYNLIFRNLRFQVRKLLEKAPLGERIVVWYRKLTSGMRKWDY